MWFLRLQSGMTVLMHAAKKGHNAVVKTLLERGAAVDTANTVGFVKCESICHSVALYF